MLTFGGVIIISSWLALISFPQASNTDIESVPVIQKTSTRCEANNNWSLPVLMYHHIGNIPDSVRNDKIRIGLTVSLPAFKNQIESIKRLGYTTITFQEFSTAISTGVCLPANPIVLTFDDGYSDNWDSAAILKQNQMKAVYYIITDKVGLPDYLNWDQVHTLANDNNEIGSHTISHPDLTNLSNFQQRLENEINGSKKILEQQGFSVVSFAYPAGKYNTAIAALVGDHYLFARTTHKGIFTSRSKRTEIGTIRMTEETNLSLILKKNDLSSDI